MKVIFTLIVILFIFPLISHNRLTACSCLSHSPVQAYQGFPSIFEGMVRSVSFDTLEIDDHYIFYNVIVRMKVSKVWKGNIPEEVIVSTSSDGASCGYNFREDTEYLVYGSAGDTISVSLCSRTRRLENAAKDLEYLRLVTSFGFGSNPEGYRLLQNYPNPFNTGTVISYIVGGKGELAFSQVVDLSVYSLSGQKIITLVHENLPAGGYKVSWDAGNLAGGIYIYTLKTSGGFEQSKKLVLLR